MTGDITTNPDFPTTTLVLGCDPQVIVTITDKGENLYVELTPADPNGDLPDIDGLFFDLNDDSEVDQLGLYPEINAQNVTGWQTDANSVDTLSNGAQVAEQHDVAIQFGTVDDSTEGTVNQVGFTIWSNSGDTLNIEDLDLDSFTAVVNSDTGNGQALTVNQEGVEDGEDGHEDDSSDDTLSFIIEGDVNVEVTLTQLDDNNVQVDMEVLSGDDPDATGEIGELRGFFFDVGDDSLLDGMSVSGADVTGSNFAANGVSDMGNGGNIHGDASDDGAFDGGVKLGSQGLGKDDIQETSFVLSNDAGLSINDFAGQDIGLRLTSVGEEGSDDREDSLKLVGEVPPHNEPPEEECEAQYDLDDILALMSPEHVVQDPEQNNDLLDDGQDDLLLL